MRHYALLGWPLDSSLSPAMHNAAFRALGMDADYALAATPPDSLRRAALDLRRGILGGANVTVPHKQAIREYLDSESDLAAKVGAVNTILRLEEGRLHGENTDVEGFRKTLEGLFQSGGIGPRPSGPADRERGSGWRLGAQDEALGGRRRGNGQGIGPSRAVVFGAGGAASAVAHVLLEEGWQVTILNRSRDRARDLARQLIATHEGALVEVGPPTVQILRDMQAELGLVVNATPLGSPELPYSPWPDGLSLPRGVTVIDLIARASTPLVERARRDGLMAVTGIPMLVVQAAAAFHLWTGVEAPVAVMRDAALAALAAESRE